ncbi:hypothetical protein [Hyphomicrobium sp.]|uniref:hypothetical protein n=1 Tax=Hyphomicrobium sp. TaxID=82 RepID=UPI002C9EADCD|nr:hypothetical protein [Hyphomicrobium sp.]HRN88236.1 hypothetical protein [Hyphomicrobium sp.]HRQ27413.1 hypothetical protein [Hyphomicrobium sp.]
MSSKASLLIVGLIVGAAAAVSPAFAATHERGTPVKAAVQPAKDLPIRTADAKPVAKTATRSEAQAVASDQGKVRPAAVKRTRKHAKAKRGMPIAANARGAAAKARATPRSQALSHAQPAPRVSPRRARYADERERALDVAAYYAPKTIARLRRNRTIERAETSRASRDAGWHRYVDTYERTR